jgi:hypothetical protein
MLDGDRPDLDGDKDWLVSQSNQEVWDSSLKNLAEGMTELMALAKTGTLDPATMEAIVVDILEAMYGFEELVERDYEPAITGPLAWNTREVIEGYANTQPERLGAGMTAILDQLKAMYGTPE